MQYVLLILIAGFGAGYLLRKKRPVIRLMDKATTWVVYLLLFLLGISVGLNDDIVHNFGEIGLQAVVISLASTVGSVLVCRLISPLIFKQGNAATKSDSDEE